MRDLVPCKPKGLLAAAGSEDFDPMVLEECDTQAQQMLKRLQKDMQWQPEGGVEVADEVGAPLLDLLSLQEQLMQNQPVPQDFLAALEATRDRVAAGAPARSSSGWRPAFTKRHRFAAIPAGPTRRAERGELFA